MQNTFEKKLQTFLTDIDISKDEDIWNKIQAKCWEKVQNVKGEITCLSAFLITDL